jgi:tRNA threonylcarbamoyl adenosine modification protein YeaZ
MTTDDLQNVLAIDSSTSVLKLGLQFQSDRMVKSGEQVEQSHGQMIIRKIQNLLESAALSIDQVNAIVVCTGPGSFTGLRIGLAAAKGIAVANDIPVVGVSLFEIAARKLSQKSAPVMVLVPFIRKEYFCCRVTAGSFEIPAMMAEGPVATIGVTSADGIGVAGNGHKLESIEYDCSDLLLLGLAQLAAGRHADLSELEPLYLMKSQAEIKFEKRQQNGNS